MNGICSQKCDWSKCPMPDYFTIGEICFCRSQNTWLIEHMEFLQDGKWPPQPSGYTQASTSEVQRSIRAVSPYDGPLQIAAELSARLDKTGEDGKDLVILIQEQAPVLTERARAALAYISGYKRRRQSYADFLKQRAYRRKMKLFGIQQIISNHI